ncbi:MAG: SulP family inorganic anion transporter, partial [Candidatus Nanopelagicaceae bacterium]|nr:SulP family inorganic anion transporter [Candidatus Nanopelagicaceae bacterium]
MSDFKPRARLTFLSEFNYLSDWKHLFDFWRKDLLAGVSVGVVALPLALGFAITTGAPASAGLVTAIIAGFIAALFGGSNFQVTGPTGAMTVVLVPIVTNYGLNSLAIIGFGAGLLIIVMALLRIGNLIDSVPISVMEGFTLGIAVIIALQQIPLIFEVDKAAGSHTLEVALKTTQAALSGGVNWVSLSLVVLTLLVKFTWPKLRMKFKYLSFIPASIVAVVILSLASELFDLTVNRIGELPRTLELKFNFNFSEVPISGLIYAIIAVALLGAIESLLSA